MKNFYIITILLAITLSSCAAPTAATEAKIEATAAISPTQEAPAEMVYEPAIVKLNLTKGVQSLGPIYVAEQKGYFKQFGITLETITMAKPTDALPLLIAGDLDVLAGTVDPGALNSMAADPNIRFVADRGFVPMGNECTYYGLLVRKDLIESGAVSKPEDLKGKNIVVGKTSPSGFLLSKYMESAGLTLNDINVIQIPPAQQLEAFKDKSLDATFTTETYLSRIMDAGVAQILVGSETISDIQISGIIFGKNLMVDNPEVGERFLAAYILGVRAYNEGKTEENLKIIAETTGEDTAILQKACWMKFNENAEMTFSGFEDYQKYMLDNGLLDQATSVEKIWEPKFIQAALKLVP